MTEIKTEHDKNGKNFNKNKEPFVKKNATIIFFFHFRANLTKSQILRSKGNFLKKNSN